MPISPAPGASDLRGGVDKLLARVVHGVALGAQAPHAYVFANRRADRLKVLSAKLTAWGLD